MYDQSYGIIYEVIRIFRASMEAFLKLEKW